MIIASSAIFATHSLLAVFLKGSAAISPKHVSLVLTQLHERRKRNCEAENVRQFYTPEGRQAVSSWTPSLSTCCEKLLLSVGGRVLVKKIVGKQLSRVHRVSSQIASLPLGSFYTAIKSVSLLLGLKFFPTFCLSRTDI